MTQSSDIPQQRSLDLDRHHNNNYLFSDYFLDTILRDRETFWSSYWEGAVADADTFLQAVTELYEQEKAALASYSESQLEDNWFKKIFGLLGHSFEGQTKVSKLKGSGVRFPDFAFFPDEATRQAAAPYQTDSSRYFQKTIAVGEVKKWDIPLGKKIKGGGSSFDDNNPSYQIDYYIRATNLTWGILSNGRLWRLVHKDTSYKLDVYFEIDLAQAIIEQNRAAALFFVLFFRQASFLPDQHGRVFLDAALEASVTYAAKLEDDLKENAYRALEQLIQGFIEPSANGLTADDIAQDFYEEANRDGLPVRLLAFADGELAGTITLREQATWTLPEYQPGLGGLLVAEQYRGRGIGTELVKAGMNLAREQGYQTVYATTVKARGILESLGWQLVREVAHDDEQLGSIAANLKTCPT